MTTAFIDCVSLLLWLVTASLSILLTYARRCREPREKLRTLAAPLASVALPFTIIGLYITLCWPLTGSANIFIGEPVLFFGTLLCMAAWLIAREEDLAVLTIVARFGGIMLIIMALAIVANGLGAPPTSEGAIGHPPIATLFSLLWSAAYLCTGICALVSRQILAGSFSRRWQKVFQVLCWTALIIFGIQAVLATLVHTSEFAGWLPMHS
jgi:uncharacterized membrane protein